MADQPDSTLRTCKHCQIEKPLAAFPVEKRRPTHKCRDCTNADRRRKYEAREGQYAKYDTPEERAKRAARYKKQRLADDEAARTIRTCRECGAEKPLTAFSKIGGWWSHQCQECRAAKRRSAYARREGEYAVWDTSEAKAKRREQSRKQRGRYVWEPSWLEHLAQKTCSRCKIELPANPAWFRKDTVNTTGLSSWCRSCEARKYDENKERYLKSQREYWRNKWAENSKALKAARTERRNKDKERARAVNRRWRSDNIDRERKRGIATENTRRARKLQAPGKFTKEHIDAMRVAQKGRCWYCSGKLDRFHVDHRIPLARGGSNAPSNLVLACPPCNLSKGAKMPWELEKGRLL